MSSAGSRRLSASSRCSSAFSSVPRPTAIGRQVEADDVFRSRHLLQRIVDGFGALVLAAIGVSASQQRQAQCDIFGPVLGQQEQVGERLSRLSVEDKGLGPITPRERKIGAALDQARKYIDRAAILARCTNMRARKSCSAGDDGSIASARWIARNASSPAPLHM